VVEDWNIKFWKAKYVSSCPGFFLILKKLIDDVAATSGTRIGPTITIAPSGMFSMTITEISLGQPIKQ
jgi:hypothetical protein